MLMKAPKYDSGVGDWMCSGCGQTALAAVDLYLFRSAHAENCTAWTLDEIARPKEEL